MLTLAIEQQKTFFLLQKTFPILIFMADMAFLKSNIDEFDKN